MQSEGENMDALVRKVTTATIEVLEKGNRRSISEMGPRRS
jgi:phenylpyruvate tautomerase PptA (4-oxalocrotonate tautomerase family)